jgi:putative membrane protein
MSERAARVTIGLVSAAVLVVVGLLLLAPRPEAVRGGLDVSALPGVNALLNGTSAVLLAVGYVFIRRRNVTAHKACMLGAFAVSTAFLLSYLAYHAQVGSVRFTGQGLVRWVYFPLLVSHLVLAAAIVPLALTTLYRAFTERFDRHRQIARWTLPIWLYVSVTGVLVYVMLHQLYAPR